MPSKAPSKETREVELETLKGLSDDEIRELEQQQAVLDSFNGGGYISVAQAWSIYAVRRALPRLLSEVRALREDQKDGRVKKPHILTDDERAAAGAFWARIEDLKVADELADYHFILQQVPEVYMHITDGRMSKPNYYAHAVIGVADDYTQDLIEEAVADERKAWEHEHAEGSSHE